MPTEPMQPIRGTPPQSGLAAPRYAYVPARAVGAYLPKLTRKAKGPEVDPEKDKLLVNADLYGPPAAGGVQGEELPEGLDQAP